MGCVSLRAFGRNFGDAQCSVLVGWKNSRMESFVHVDSETDANILSLRCVIRNTFICEAGIDATLLGRWIQEGQTGGSVDTAIIVEHSLGV